MYVETFINVEKGLSLCRMYTCLYADVSIGTGCMSFHLRKVAGGGGQNMTPPPVKILIPFPHAPCRPVGSGYLASARRPYCRRLYATPLLAQLLSKSFIYAGGVHDTHTCEFLNIGAFVTVK